MEKQSLKLFLRPIQLPVKCNQTFVLISQTVHGKDIRFSRKIIIYASNLPTYQPFQLEPSKSTISSEIKRENNTNNNCGSSESNKKIKTHRIYYDDDRLMNGSDLMHVLCVFCRCLNDLQNETQIKSDIKM